LLHAVEPIAVMAGDPDLDSTLAGLFGVQSQLIQLLRPNGDEPWALGVHHCDTLRKWTSVEVSRFSEIGRCATLALNNALLHERALREITKVTAILDQIPEAAAIYDASGRLERMNVAASGEALSLFAQDPETRILKGRHRHIDGTPLEASDLPSMRALRGEVVRSDYLIHDPRVDDDRVINFKAVPIHDGVGRIIGSVVLTRDVTDERRTSEREAMRRRRAECLANLGLEMVTLQTEFQELDTPALQVAQAVAGTVRIYLYHPANAQLELTGFASTEPGLGRLRKFFAEHPYRSGEGLAGTAFQIGRPMFFYEIRGDAVLDFARDEKEREVTSSMHEQSLIACPIESYGERIGAIVVAHSDLRRNFDAEDLEFVQSVAQRIGTASHIQRLTRLSSEGHRAAEEIARREVDARVRFEAVLESAPIGVAVISADELRFELANARFIDFVERFGRISADTRLLGLRVAEVIPPFEQPVRLVADSGEMRMDEGYEVRLATGSMYVNRVFSPVRGRFSGITQSITILVQDVTDQVRAKREIEDLAQAMGERSARLDSILASMTDGLWVYDAGGKVISVNEAALTMFGLASRTEAVEHGSLERFELRYPDGRGIPADDLPYARALRGMTVPDYLAMGRHLISGKDLDLSIAVAPIESNGIVGAVLVMRDITALQELDRKKDEFLSVASHELRTPLTTIKGYTQLIAQTINDLPAEERTTYLNAVLGEIDRMMGLISELLDVSRIETNRLQIDRQSVRWLEFLQRRAAAFRIQNPLREIRFSSSIPETIMLVDPDRIRQVVDNLLSNAVKYSPEGSPIEVSVSVEGDSMRTAVMDRGIGIPSDELNKLFERFHRARNVSSRYYGGLGLGLYIAKAIVEAHSGSIGVVSEEGQGATFTVGLPLH
ncbi:MAG: ATP-binding protein, partial [Thermoanaerobaculia bacterium]